MTNEWTQLKEYILERRNFLRNTKGKFSRENVELHDVLMKMAELDPTITAEEIGPKE
jgi:hypothetical protein